MVYTKQRLIEGKKTVIDGMLTPIEKIEKLKFIERTPHPEFPDEQFRMIEQERMWAQQMMAQQGASGYRPHWMNGLLGGYGAAGCQSAYSSERVR